MVTGNGLIASAFKKSYQNDDRYVIFASGVSNSNETNVNSFIREELLIRETLTKNKDKHFIYFTSFIYFKKYGLHKIYMEDIIRGSGVDYTIFKLPQIIGRGGNMNNLFNYLVFNIKNNKVVKIYNNVYRSLIDIDDLKRIVDISLRLSECYVIIPYIEKMLVMDIVLLISKVLNIEPKINIIESNGYAFPERSITTDYILQELDITTEGYTERIINKYLA